MPVDEIDQRRLVDRAVAERGHQRRDGASEHRRAPPRKSGANLVAKRLRRKRADRDVRYTLWYSAGNLEHLNEAERANLPVCSIACGYALAGRRSRGGTECRAGSAARPRARRGRRWRLAGGREAGARGRQPDRGGPRAVGAAPRRGGRLGGIRPLPGAAAGLAERRRRAPVGRAADAVRPAARAGARLFRAAAAADRHRLDQARRGAVAERPRGGGRNADRERLARVLDDQPPSARRFSTAGRTPSRRTTRRGWTCCCGAG